MTASSLESSFGLVILEGSGGGIVGLDPLGHPHVGRQMRALREKLLELAPIEQRLFCLGRVERIGLRRHLQLCVFGSMIID